MHQERSCTLVHYSSTTQTHGERIACVPSTCSVYKIYRSLRLYAHYDTPPKFKISTSLCYKIILGYIKCVEFKGIGFIWHVIGSVSWLHVDSRCLANKVVIGLACQVNYWTLKNTHLKVCTVGGTPLK